MIVQVKDIPCYNHEFQYQFILNPKSKVGSRYEYRNSFRHLGNNLDLVFTGVKIL